MQVKPEAPAADFGRSPSSNWSCSKRLCFSFVTGTAITLLGFSLLVSQHHIWQLNYFLAPGAIVAVILGFITHYGGPWYALTLISANSAFYSSLVYGCVAALGKTRRKPPVAS